nr:ribonuclease H-like domain-containing protein [Tanacetum cinerariifolium]
MKTKRRCYDWSYQADEEPANFALMAITSSSPSSDNELSPSKPAQDLSHTNRPSAPIIEDWVSDSEDESETNDPQIVPNFVQSSEQVTTPKTSVQPSEHMVHAAIHIWSKPISITAVRPVSAVVPKIMVTRPRHAHSIGTKFKSPIRRYITRSKSPKTSSSPPRVTAAQVPVVSATQENMSYLSDFEELNGGYVAFGGNLKGGKISGKGKIKTGKLDFEDVYFVKELKFNLFSVSQMYDKKNSVLFTDTECLVLSPDFKLSNESQVLLRVSRESNMCNVNLKNIVPYGDLTCLFAKATIDESNLWHKRLGHINFKTINKLVKGKARALAEATLRERDENIFVLQKKLRLLEEQSKVFHEISNQEMKQQIILFEEDKRMFLAKNEFLEQVSSSVQKEYNDLMASNDVLRQSLETKFNLLQNDKSLEQTIKIIEKEMGNTVKCFDAEKKVFENEISKLEKVLEQRRVKDFDEVNTELSKRTDKFETYFSNLEKENALLKSQLASQNYTSLQKENNDLKTSYNVLKEEYEISFLKNSIPKVNVSEKISKGESSKPISKMGSQFTTYFLQKDRKYLKKQHSSETFAFQNHMKNKSSKQMWKSKENISKRFKYSRDEMFSMRKRDDSILKKVKDVRFPFISKRIFPNETPSFNNKWKSSSSSRINTSNETPGFRTMSPPLKSVKTPNETSRFYKSKWTNEKSFKSPLIPRTLFRNEIPSFKSPWNSTSMHQIDANYIWFSKYGKPVSNVLKWVPKVVV